MNKVDLHVHSTASDGTFTPAELVRAAVKAELSAFALTMTQLQELMRLLRLPTE